MADRENIQKFRESNTCRPAAAENVHPEELDYIRKIILGNNNTSTDCDPEQEPTEKNLDDQPSTSTGCR